MSNNIQFETDTTNQRSYLHRDASGKPMSSMAAWLVKHNLAKDASGAQGILIALVIVNAIIIYVLIKYFT